MASGGRRLQGEEVAEVKADEQAEQEREAELYM
jgi:hypothetical protein